MIKIEFNNFPTHVKLSSKKNFKLSTQQLYNQKLNPHSRNKVIKEMKTYITPYLKGIKPFITFPLKLKFIFCIPHNYGDVRMFKGKLNWKECGKDYKASWDIDNRAFIWSKTINDAMVEMKLIPDDTVDYITTIEYEYKRIDQLDNRQIILEIYE